MKKALLDLCVTSIGLIQQLVSGLVLGDKIRIVRQIKGISQLALAVKLNISQAAYSKIESGKTVLTNERLEIILRELNISDKTLRDFDSNTIFNEHI